MPASTWQGGTKATHRTGWRSAELSLASPFLVLSRRPLALRKKTRASMGQTGLPYCTGAGVVGVRPVRGERGCAENTAGEPARLDRTLHVSTVGGRSFVASAWLQTVAVVTCAPLTVMPITVSTQRLAGGPLHMWRATVGEPSAIDRPVLDRKRKQRSCWAVGRTRMPRPSTWLPKHSVVRCSATVTAHQTLTAHSQRTKQDDGQYLLFC